MEITSSSRPSSPDNHVRPSKRQRSETPTALSFLPSGSTSVLGLDRRVESLQEENENLKKKLSELEKLQKLNIEIKDKIIEKSNYEINILQTDLKKAQVKIEKLEEKLNAADEDLARKEERIQALTMELEHLMSNEMHSHLESPSTSSRLEESKIVIHEYGSLKTEEVVIPEDPNFQNNSVLQTEPSSETIVLSQANSTATDLESGVPTYEESRHSKTNRAEDNAVPSISRIVLTISESNRATKEVQRCKNTQEKMIPNENRVAMVNSTSQEESDATVNGIPETSIQLGFIEPQRVAPGNQKQVSSEQTLINVSTEYRPCMMKFITTIPDAFLTTHECQPGTSSASSEPKNYHSQAEIIVKEEINRTMEPLILRKKSDEYEVTGAEVMEVEPNEPDPEKNRDSSVTADDKQPSSTKKVSGRSSANLNQASHSLSEAEGGHNSPLLQKKILLNVGNDYCCLVLESFLKVDWSEWCLRKGPSKANWEDLWACKRCPKRTFRSSILVQDHAWVHHKGEKFLCPYCSADLQKREVLSSHVRMNHPDLYKNENVDFRQKASRMHNMPLQSQVPYKPPMRGKKR
ncbi:uncharacterized protein LOC107047802 [Diachasma alloeum]|uniref:uncharacterized protein LOC107047802 n=1 Tax=Diachasma alloeum TaxID=454923 RepID=UPI0007383D94|nr:uncharacterized protein LOC107047802 [Diachasma alloeum]XP_015126127.1 uncharacterized protein LOC107047802 [Diachasma alloeum]